MLLADFPPFTVKGENDCGSLLDAGRSLRGWSRIGQAMLCPQKYAYTELLGVQLIGTDPLLAGSLGHVMQAHHLTRQGAALGGVVANESWVTDPDVVLPPEDAAAVWAQKNSANHLLGAAVDTFRRYLPRYANIGRPLAVEHEVVGVVVAGPRYRWAPVYDLSSDDPRAWTFTEQDGTTIEPYRLSNGEPVVLTRRWDAAVRESLGDFVWDHKHTGANIDTSRADTAYAVDGGFVGLRILGREVLGERFSGVRLNLVQRRPPYGVEQPTVGRHSNLAAQFAQQLIDAEERLVYFRSVGRDPWEYPKIMGEASGCEGKYGLCPAIKLCLHGKRALHLLS